MTRRQIRLAGTVGLAVFAGAVIFVRRPHLPDAGAPSGKEPEAAVSQTLAAPSQNPVAGAGRVDDPRRVTTLVPDADGLMDWPATVAITSKLNAAGEPPNDDIAIVQGVLTQYRVVYRENPPGGLNEEISAALRGENPRRIRFLPGDSARFSAKGELLDRWNTPYFFHKLSSQLMEVRSAGPDRRLWNADDIAPRVEGGPPL